MAAALVLLALYGVYMLWFRNFSWFAIHDVTIKGATTNQREIKSAVEGVAGDMTTLHIEDASCATPSRASRQWPR